MKNSDDLPQLKEGSPFSDLLYKMSPKYKLFLNRQKQIKKEADMELGFDSENFLKNIYRIDKIDKLRARRMYLYFLFLFNRSKKTFKSNHWI